LLVGAAGLGIGDLELGIRNWEFGGSSLRFRSCKMIENFLERSNAFKPTTKLAAQNQKLKPI
jgi:hypothetical protein